MQNTGTKIDSFVDFSAYKGQDFENTSDTDLLLETSLVGCEKCDTVAPARIMQHGDIVYMEKGCCASKVFLDDNVELFKKLYLRFVQHDEKLIEGGSFSGLLSGAKDGSAVTMLHVNSRCNLDCPICYLKYCEGFEFGKTGDPTVDEIRRNLKEDSKSKLAMVMGTEPTLRDDLPEIISLIRSSGRQCDLLTNGMRLVDRSYVRKLKDAGVWRVCTWMDGLSDDIYRKLRGGSYLATKMAALKNLKDDGMQTELMCVIGKGINEDQVPLILNFALKNTDFIHDVNFDCLTTGSVHTEHSMGPSNLHRLISESIGVDLDYFVEFKRLRHNLHEILGRFSALSLDYQRLVLDNYFFKVEGGSLRPVVTTAVLRSMNDALEEKDPIRKAFGIVRNVRGFFGVARSVSPRVMKTMAAWLPDSFYNWLNSDYFKVSVLKVEPWGEAAGRKGHYSYIETGGDSGSTPSIANTSMPV